jgi:hypothetical protein
LAYSIHWRPDGAVKFFTGQVSFKDIINSEREIAGSSIYMTLKYVIAMYIDTQHSRLSEAELVAVRALRLGGYYSNPRIKYAFVTDDANIKNAIERSVIDGQTLHATRVYESYENAFAWVNGKGLGLHMPGVPRPLRLHAERCQDGDWTTT